MNPRVVVASPGAPEMVHMAEALAAEGALRAYVAPFAPTRFELESGPLSRLGPLGQGIIGQLRRRVVSEEVGHAERYPVARAADIAATAALRLGLKQRCQERLADWRSHAIESGVASILRASDTDLIVPAGAAGRPLAQARKLGVRGWLDCPTAHHRYAERLLTRELALQPDFAETMQFPAPTARAADQLSREIEMADELIVLSSFQLRTFEEEEVTPKRHHVLPLGVDVDLFRPTNRIRRGPFTIGFVGQITQRKGISYLMTAFEALRPRGVRLLMVGNPVGPRDAWIREGVEHHPAVARKNLPDFYAQMDVFVLPSLIEGFGLTALEAMASGVPVILSENTFGSDIVTDGHDGFVVPIRSAEAIVERVRALSSDRSMWATMSANGRGTSEKYTWRAFGMRLLGLLASS